MGTTAVTATTSTPAAPRGRRPLPVCAALHCTTKLHGEEQKTAGLCLRHIQNGATHRKPAADGSTVLAYPTRPGYVRVSEGALNSWWESLSVPAKAAVFQGVLEDIESRRHWQ